MSPLTIVTCAVLLLATPTLQLDSFSPEGVKSNIDRLYNTSSLNSLKFSHAKTGHPAIKLADEEDVKANMPQILRQNSEFARAFTKRFPSPRDMAMFIADVAKKPRSGLTYTCAIHVIDGFAALEKWETWALRMLDSWGRPGPGIMSLYPVFRGVFDECQHVKARKPERHTQSEGKYQHGAESQDPSSYNDRAHQFSNVSKHTGASEHGQRSAYVSKMAAADTARETHGRASAHTENHRKGSKHSFLEVVNYLDNYFNAKDRHPDYEVAFRGKYCRVGVSSYAIPMNINVIPILKVYLGISYEVCVPDSCTSQDVDILANQTVMAMVFQSNLAQFEVEKTTCVDVHPPWDTKAIVIVIFIAMSLLGISACTAYDIIYIQRPIWKLQRLKEEFIAKREMLLKPTEAMAYDTNGHLINGSVVLNGNDRERLLHTSERLLHTSESNGSLASETGNGTSDVSLENILFQEQELSTFAKALQFFSVYTNGQKIGRTKLQEKTLSCVHGIRFLSMCWIVLGHTLLVALVDTDNILEFIFVYRQKLMFMILANGFLCVDTFFVLSGTMVGYVFIHVVENETRIKYLVYVLHRFMRLSPALIVFGAIYICLWPHFGTGPNYPSKAPDEDMCRENWAYTLFYINNFLPMDKLVKF
ncbi:nose resistant to fluoxetine protein 6-like [Elysia marginata]|uniref:Nose resistant to fluoxetine protein 6-like n=1 Tax=Elysia marginata TaxID=1093978 RepID=A0AAV4IHI6_9GAST|nr:nose resistant to fluoxetine protein 6-like [Elysia marginata]